MFSIQLPPGSEPGRAINIQARLRWWVVGVDSVKTLPYVHLVAPSHPLSFLAF